MKTEILQISQHKWCDSSNFSKVMNQFCSHRPGKITQLQQKYHDDEEILQEATKPEVVITMGE